MKQFEYLVAQRNNGPLAFDEQFLNHMGEQGWELVSVAVHGGFWFYFKRLKQ